MPCFGAGDPPSTPQRNPRIPGTSRLLGGAADDDATPRPSKLLAGSSVGSDSDNEETPKARRVGVGRRPTAAETLTMVEWDRLHRTNTMAPRPRMDWEGRDALVSVELPSARLKVDSKKVLEWKDTYKTVADLLLKSTLPRMPPVFDQTRLTGTKDMTEAEFYIPLHDCLRYIVYWPNLLAKAEREAQRLLSALKLDWNRPEHVIFAAYCLPDMFGPLLPEVVHSENDVVSWSNGGIFRPALAAFRACTLLPSARVSLFGGLDVPRLLSAPVDLINLDCLVVQKVELLDGPTALARQEAAKAQRKQAEDKQKAWLESMGYEVERVRPKSRKTTKIQATTTLREPRTTAKGTKPKGAKQTSAPGQKNNDKVAIPVPLLTIEAKTHRVWSDKSFASIFDMPVDSGVEAHPMRFAWPKTINDQANKETRVIIQVSGLGQMTHYKVNYAILSCYEWSVFLMRQGDTMFVSRKYSYIEYPQFRAFAHFLLAQGKVPEHKLPDLSSDIQRLSASLLQRLGLLATPILVQGLALAPPPRPGPERQRRFVIIPLRRFNHVRIVDGTLR
ncbi:hypothetical protein C8T65DRAFT_672637 [Cerioporus squamosus]|nr:hypothetical protein C8T65DRAFT_672637 [Cerioporus squamosus]